MDFQLCRWIFFLTKREIYEEVRNKINITVVKFQ